MTEPTQAPETLQERVDKVVALIKKYREKKEEAKAIATEARVHYNTARNCSGKPLDEQLNIIVNAKATLESLGNKFHSAIQESREAEDEARELTISITDSLSDPFKNNNDMDQIFPYMSTLNFMRSDVEKKIRARNKRAAKDVSGGAKKKSKE